MREYKSKIALTQNSRGIYCLDTSIGCSSGVSNEVGGCYGDCYAAKSAKIYGYDFSKTVLRFFNNKKHERSVISKINGIKLDFVRIGCSGDPSENWEHTFNILKVISKSNKEIVIITRHWTILSDEQLECLKTMNICINTSVSALDKPELRNRSIEQYNRLKYYCKSVLRIVSCDFNLDNEEGKRLSAIQHNLFKNESTLDTVFRPNKNNNFVTDGVINTSIGLFLNKKCLMSKLNKKTYLGKCSTCHEMCGLKIQPETKLYPEKRFLPKQLVLFKTR